MGAGSGGGEAGGRAPPPHPPAGNFFADAVAPKNRDAPCAG